MERLKPLLAAVLGLMLLVQGVAIAAAPVEIADTAEQAAMEMPCHGDVDTAPCDCCDGDCPDMAGCVIGQFFAAMPVTPVLPEPAAHAAAAAGGWSAKTAVLSLPDRPPILSLA